MSRLLVLAVTELSTFSFTAFSSLNIKISKQYTNKIKSCQSGSEHKRLENDALWLGRNLGMRAADLPPNSSVKQENKSKTTKNGGPHNQNRKTESAYVSP